MPKKNNVQCMKDLRSIALTSCIMKVFERCLLSYLDHIVSNSIDPYQFAYRPKRSVEDAILHVRNNVYKHLEKPASSVRLMFYDFSCAFNTIQPHLPCDKLINCDLFPSTILWILDYLSSRPQVVKLSPILSVQTQLQQILVHLRGQCYPLFFSPYIHLTVDHHTTPVLLTSTRTILYSLG